MTNERLQDGRHNRTDASVDDNSETSTSNRTGGAEGRLLADAARAFSRVGIEPWVFAAMKLRIDPVYREILKQGILQSSGRIVDLGCGQALTLSAIRAAQRSYEKKDFPRGWRPPPRDVELLGFDIREKEVSIAQRALSVGEAQIHVADLRTVRVPECRTAIVVDALHYMEPHEQEELLVKTANAIEIGGTLVVREADASGGPGFHAVRLSETLRARLRGQWRQRFHYRSAEEWADRIASLGFDTRIQDMSGRSPFRNVLVLGVRCSS